MGYRELIDALHREGEEKVRSILQDAEAEAGRIRRDASGRINQIREDCSRMQSRAVNEQNETILSEADRRARMILLSAEKELSDRLYTTAVHALNLLREKRYPDVFGDLTHELPPYQWEVVRVNPDDEGRAREYFPNCEIISDGSITGGLDVMEKEGRIRVVNTFEKRLGNLWTEILPTVIRDIHEKIAGHGITEKG